MSILFRVWTTCTLIKIISLFHYSIFFQVKFTAIIYPNGKVFVYLDMLEAIKVIIKIKKYKFCKEKEVKVKKFSLRACITGRPQPNPSLPHCLSKLVLQNIK